ncbi:hypothetical protein ASPSYDRAFT_45345 [Aspergillus sydowii CBS 593.65]|uniref:Ketoreductase (KR) domain-containing protein n=1 Tax=Aspergillus sydowii CBS 593.65 TaxID=1036612 RepID=A0A1L9THM2_9EURO|nr:uncharacterized protein ASPSYDRAFT_45345 [Aspergillus sydowii CBS 593.65]OJJ58926.1 hypothetical protein ASPSYDRAFT_45345 [Aspergillus sydowii CBS 593.65]
MSDEIATQPHNLPLLATEENTAGKTYIVTGANTGLGFEASKHLVNLGAKKVILAVRSVPSGEAAKKKIDEATGKASVAEVWALDLSSYESVKAFANRATTELDRIDAVIENAAVATGEQKSAEGYHIGLTVNVLSTFLLAVLLLPKLKESAEKHGILPRLSIVTSGVGFDVRQVWEMVKEDPFVRASGLPAEQLMATYPLSKLMDTFAVRELAAQLPLDQGKVVINAVCPGLCKTELVRNAPPPQKESILNLHAQFGRSAEDGSRTLLAGANLGEDSHGGFTSSCEIRNDKVPDWAKDEEAQKWQKNLWDLIVKEIDATVPGAVGKALGK